MQKLWVGIVLLVIFSIAVVAIHTAETRYTVDPPTAEKRDIVTIENRYGVGYVNPLGGFGAKGASRGSFGFKGGEEGASVLATNSFIVRGRSPAKISNSYASARGYRIINKYVKLESVTNTVVYRPQINGTPEGHARVISNRPQGNYLTVGTVVMRTRDLPKLDGFVYETWLVDEDTGYYMSLGIFLTSQIGRIGTFKYKSSTAFDPFENIVVTIEPFPDKDPSPGPIVLSGLIEENIVRAYR